MRNAQFDNMQKLAFGKVNESVDIKSRIKELVAKSLGEAKKKEFEFSFHYNTDEDDVEYINNILMDANADAVAEPGLDSEEMIVKAPNAVELRRAKKAIEQEGFEINENVSEAKKKKEKPEDVIPQEDEIEVEAVDTIEPDHSVETDIDPKVKAVQDSLQKAFANAQALGDEKLMTQIGNSITYFTRTQVLGSHPLAEGEEDFKNSMEDENDFQDIMIKGQSAVQEYYLEMLHKFEETNTDDAADFKNLAAVARKWASELEAKAEELSKQ